MKLLGQFLASDEFKIQNKGHEISWLWATLALILVNGTLLNNTAQAQTEPLRFVLGAEEVVYDWGTDRCENHDIADMATRVFRDQDEKIHLIATHNNNKQKVGPDFERLIHECDTVLEGNLEPDFTLFDGFHWLTGIYTLDGRTIHSVMHTEYHGRLIPGTEDECPTGEGVGRICDYYSLVYSSSDNGGGSYSHIDAPDHLVAALPYPFEHGLGPFGVRGGTNIIEKDGYYYFLTNFPEYEAQEFGMGLIRTEDLADPESWRCWDGDATDDAFDGFTVRFIDPYREPDFDPADHVCATVNGLGNLHNHLSYNTYLEKYLLVGHSGFIRDPQTNEEIHGFFYSLSDDLINWTPVQLLWENNHWNSDDFTRDRFGYPALIDPDDTSRNFEFTGNQVYMYYTVNHGNLDRDTMRRTVDIIDDVPPAIEISAPSESVVKNGDTLSYIVSYSDATAMAIELKPGDVNVITESGNPPPSAVVQSVVDNGDDTFTVTLNDFSGDGELSISIDPSTAADLFGNAAGAAGPSEKFTVDNTPPEITISAPDLDLSNFGPVRYTLTYSDATAVSVNLNPDQVSLNPSRNVNIDEVNKTVVGSLNTRSVRISGFTGNGDLGISIDPNSAMDEAGNWAEGAGPSATFEVDNMPPSVNIVGPNVPATRTGPVSYMVIFEDGSTVDMDSSDVELRAVPPGSVVVDNEDVSVTPTGDTTWLVMIDNISGNGLLLMRVKSGIARDAAGNTNLRTEYENTPSLIVDNVPPSVNISPPSVSATNTGPVEYTVSYEDANPVILDGGNLASKFILNGVGDVDLTNVEKSVTRDGDSWTVTLNNLAGDGQLYVRVSGSTAADVAGNTAPGTTFGNSIPVTVDNTPPKVSISAPSILSTKTGPVSYTVSYGDTNPVILDEGDLASKFFTSGAGDVDLTNVEKSVTRDGDSWTVTLNNLAGDGQLFIRVSGGTATDAAGNPAPGTTFDNSIPVTVDNTPPEVSISAPSVLLTKTGPVEYTVSYEDENSVLLDEGDLASKFFTSGAGDVDLTNVEKSVTRNADSWTVTLNNLAGDGGQLFVRVSGNTAVDVADNPAPGTTFGNSIPVTVDNTPPAVSISGPDVSETATGPVVYTLTYTGADAVSLTEGDINVVTLSGTATGEVLPFPVSLGGDDMPVVTIGNISGNGSLAIRVTAGTASDVAGNEALGAGPSESVLVDDTDTDEDGEPDLNDLDDDNDGLEDAYEESHSCLDPLVDEDANQDADGDGLTSLEEFTISAQLNPCDADTDGDKIDDLLDSDPLIGDNVCSGSDEAILTDAVNTEEEIQCGAAISITVRSPASIEDGGVLRLISPQVIIEPDFSTAGQLSIESLHPCTGCSP